LTEQIKHVDFFIITGLSGAGKTFANKVLEDLGFYCVDNLPPMLIPSIAELAAHSERKIDKVSLVIDIRGGDFFEEVFKALDALDKAGYRYKIIFLDAADDVLVRRYKESRRLHPLAGSDGGVIDGIRNERARLKRIKDRADFYIDTTKMNPWGLKQALSSIVMGDEKASQLKINIVSFGFKYGLPLDADLVFDVRFLPNPYYEQHLKNLSGENEEVFEYVMTNPATREFLDKVSDLINFILPHAINEGKSNMVIAVGCTGGHHRSVVLAIELCRIITRHGYNVSVKHRDISAD